MHDHLIGRILAEEEELIARHRTHIDRMVELMKVEMGHVRMDGWPPSQGHPISRKLRNSRKALVRGGDEAKRCKPRKICTLGRRARKDQ